MKQFASLVFTANNVASAATTYPDSSSICQQVNTIIMVPIEQLKYECTQQISLKSTKTIVFVSSSGIDKILMFRHFGFEFNVVFTKDEIKAPSLS